MAYAIAVFIQGLFVFIVAEFAAMALPKSWRPHRILRGLTFLWVGWNLFSIGFFGNLMPPPDQTVAKLMEQARGDKLHWNRYGKSATRWEEGTRRHYKRSCQTYALKQLGEMGPAANSALPELIELFNEKEDYNSGDGVYCLQSENAKTLGAIGHRDAIEPLIGMLLTKSLTPDEDNGLISSNILWHYDGPYNEKRGTGPQAIMMGLMSMPSEYHPEIVDKLKDARAEIEQSELLNDWAKFEIDRGLRFFGGNKKVKARARRYVEGAWNLEEHADFEKLLDPQWERAPIQTRTLLSGGQWAQEVSTPEEQKIVCALEKHLKKMGFKPSDLEKKAPVKIKYRVEEGMVEISSVGWRTGK